MSSEPLDPRRPVYFAFLAMPFLMGVLSHLLVPTQDGGFSVALPDGTRPLHWALLGFAVALTAGSIALGYSNDAPPGVGHERREPGLSARWIIRLAMAESVAMLGLVSTMLLQRPGAWVPFSLCSLAALIVARPISRP